MATLPIEGWDALYRATDQPKNMILSFSDGTTLRNPQIVLEQMSLEESLCSEENLRFGCCESSCFQIRVVNNEQSFEGLYLNVVQAFPPQLVRLIGSDDSYIIDDQGDYISGADIFYAQYGNFLVVSDKPTGDRQYRDLTCYDKMYEIIHANVFEWYDGLTFPISVKDFRDSFFEYLNVAQVETDLINDDFEIQGEFYVSEELSGRMVIESICELNGAFGHINRDGLFEYITLPTEDSLTYPHYVNGTCAYEDYETEAITGIRAINVEGDSGTVVGTEVNPYIMQSNILTFGSEGSEELMDALNNMLDLVSQFTYTPFKVTTYGNPMLPLGTNVTFETRYKTINSFVMTRYLSGLQALRDTFTTLGDRMYPQDVNRIKNEIQRSGGLTHKLTNDVNTLDSEIFDEHGNSRITQTLDKIVMKVDDNGNVGIAELGSDEVDETYMKFNANKVEITSDTIKFDNDGYEVKGQDFITQISPNVNDIKKDLSYIQTQQFFPSLTLPDDVLTYSNKTAYILCHFDYRDETPSNSVFRTFSNQINCSRLATDDSTTLNFTGTISGLHYIITSPAYSRLVADGGYIDERGALHVPINKNIKHYLHPNIGIGVLMDEPNEFIMSGINNKQIINDNPIPLFYVRVQDSYKIYMDAESNISYAYFLGDGVPVVIAPDWAMKVDGTMVSFNQQ